MNPIVREQLLDMRREALAAINLVQGKDAARVAEDPVLSRALALSLILIGEAANQIPKEFRELHGLVAWDDARALRNRIVHGYRTVVPQVLVETAEHDLPVLVRQLDEMLKGATGA